MRVPVTEHLSRPWLIHGVAPDFTVQDVWQLPTPGGPGDFHLLLDHLAGAGRPEDGFGPVSRLVWAARWKLGEVLGWDAPHHREQVTSLRARLPSEIRDLPTGPALGQLPFDVVYRLPGELAAEIINGTVHGVLHLSWVPDDAARPEGRHHARMAVLVKPRGRLGAAYMAGIAPFRHLLIYPALMREHRRLWPQLTGCPAPTDRPVSSAVGVDQVPADALARLSLTDIGDVDWFSLPTDADSPAEEWARAMFGNGLGPANLLIDGVVLGTRVRTGAAPSRIGGSSVSGWGDGADGTDWIRTEAVGPHVWSQLVITAQNGAISLTTAMQYADASGAWRWNALSPIHRRLAPLLLRSTAARLEARPSSWSRPSVSAAT